MSLRVTKDDTEKVLQSIQAMAGKFVAVGVPSDKTTRVDQEFEGPITNSALAFIHENGSPARNIPARSFLVVGVKTVLDDCVKVLKQYASSAFDKASEIDKGLEAAGLIAQTAVKKRIVSGEGFEPLKDGTLAARKRKGHKGTKPLIRTGQLMNSITYVVRVKK